MEETTAVGEAEGVEEELPTFTELIVQLENEIVEEEQNESLMKQFEQQGEFLSQVDANNFGMID